MKRQGPQGSMHVEWPNERIVLEQSSTSGNRDKKLTERLNVHIDCTFGTLARNKSAQHVEEVALQARGASDQCRRGRYPASLLEAYELALIRQPHDRNQGKFLFFASSCCAPAIKVNR
jgi:hypothetical protein